jgi:hypothetical protein
MDYENKSKEELLIIRNSIDIFLLVDDYENAFAKFLLFIVKLNSYDRNELIHYYYNLFKKKYSK